MVIGDSEFEMDAAKILVLQFSQGILKTIKLKETPTVEEIIKQHSLLKEKLDDIYANPKNMTIMLQK